MTDGELVVLSSNVDSLTDIARSALNNELRRRGLSEEKTAAYVNEIAKTQAEHQKRRITRFWGWKKAIKWLFFDSPYTAIGLLYAVGLRAIVRYGLFKKFPVATPLLLLFLTLATLVLVIFIPARNRKD